MSLNLHKIHFMIRLDLQIILNNFFKKQGPCLFNHLKLLNLYVRSMDVYLYEKINIPQSVLTWCLSNTGIQYYFWDTQVYLTIAIWMNWLNLCIYEWLTACKKTSLIPQLILGITPPFCFPLSMLWHSWPLQLKMTEYICCFLTTCKNAS